MCAARNKIALVLEGGGMRSLYTAGVLDAFLKQGLSFDNCYGVSAGACMAMSFLSGQPGRNYRVNTRYLSDPRYLSVRSYLKTGSVFGMNMIFHTIPDILDPLDWQAIGENPAKLFVGVTNCYTGKAEFYPLRKREQVSLLQASSSLPGLSKPVYHRGAPYLDGGIAAPIPVDEALKTHDKAVVILTRTANYRKEKSKTTFLVAKKHPDFAGLLRTMNTRHILYNRTLQKLSALEAEGRVLIFRPAELHASRTERDRKKLTDLYLQGFADGIAKEDALAAFCGI